MRRGLGYVVAWGTATIVAVTGSWVGLQPLLAATSPELATPLSAPRLRDAAPTATARPDGTTPPVGATPSGDPPPVPTTPPPAAGPTDGTGDDAGPHSEADPGREQSPPADRRPDMATEPAGPLLPATSGWREVPDGPGFERTFVVRGGEVVFRVSRRDVRVVEHTANPGYDVKVTRWSRSSLILSFESLEHTSRIWVIWRNGPYAEVTETV